MPCMLNGLSGGQVRACEMAIVWKSVVLQVEVGDSVKFAVNRYSDGDSALSCDSPPCSPL